MRKIFTLAGWRAVFGRDRLGVQARGDGAGDGPGGGRRRALMKLAGAGIGLGLAGATVGEPSRTAPAHASETVLLDDPGYLDVRAFGAVGDGMQDDTGAIRAAFSSLREGKVLVFPTGMYAISDTIDGRDRPNVSIIGESGATIRAVAGASFDGRVMVDLCGSSAIEVSGLAIDSSAAGTPPVAGLVLGRTEKNTGGSATFRGCQFGGAYTLATVYTAATEVLTFNACRFESSTAQPAYYDTATDVLGLTGIPGRGNSNTRKAFWNCTFVNASERTDVTFISLNHAVSEVASRGCMFSFGDGSGAVLRVQGSEPNSVVGQVFLDTCRVQGASRPDTRLLLAENTNGINRVRLSSLSWELASDALIDISAPLIDSDLWFPDGTFTVIRVRDGGRLASNRLYGQVEGRVQIDTGGSMQGNIVI